MKYTTFSSLPLPVPRLLLGTASGPFIMGEDCKELLDAALARGLTAIDTARNYGLAERSVGDWLEARGCRDRVTILSKCAHPDEATGRDRLNDREIREDLAQSLSYLHTDVIDIYLLHRDDEKLPAGTAVEILNALMAEGKIRAFGGSNWRWQRIEEANEYAYAHNLQPFTFSSPHFSLARQQTNPWIGEGVSVTGPEGEEERAFYRRSGMPLIAYSALGRGMFAGRMKSSDEARMERFLDEFAVKGYGCHDNFERLARCEKLAAAKGVSVPQTALAWLLGQPENVFAAVTMSSPARMDENIAAAELVLTQDEKDWLDLRRDDLPQAGL